MHMTFVARFFILFVLLHALQVGANNATYCTRTVTVTEKCHCHTGNCEECHQCDCCIRLPFSSDCDYGSCSTCWCNNCGHLCGWDCQAVPCKCKEVCDQCPVQHCDESVTYAALTIIPPHGPTIGGTTVNIGPGEYVNTHGIKCKFANVIVSGNFVSESIISCVTPLVEQSVLVPVSLSLDNGTNWAFNDAHFRYFECVDNCSNGGECQPDQSCVCFVGKWGSLCANNCPQSNNLACSGRSIRSDGNCNPIDGTCNCIKGYFGVACENPCPGVAEGNGSCNNNGECLMDGSCHCNTGFGGVDCSVNCSSGCTECPHGYYGTNCTDICPGGTINPCSNHGMCSLSGLCVCNKGYYGNSCENECKNGISNPCNGHSVQENDNCNSNGTCDCDIAYWGEFCENECPTTTPGIPCSSHGECSDLGACSCSLGWAGDKCDIQCLGFVNNTVCNGHGECNNDGDCICDPALYFGEDCSQVCQCNSNGICTPTGQCNCYSGHWGPSCENSCLPSSDNPCNSRGRCDSQTGVCTCDTGSFGEQCENLCPGGFENSCNGFGVCDQNGICHCIPGHKGVDCLELYCPYECYGHGTCDNGLCNCTDNWSGQYCGTPPNAPANRSAKHGVIHFLQPSIIIHEAAAEFVITLRRGLGNEGHVFVSISTVDITAKLNKDYVSFSEKFVHWQDKDSTDKNITIVLVQDSIPEADEQFLVVMNDTFGGALLGTPSQVEITIQGHISTSEIIEVHFKLLYDYHSISDKSAFINKLLDEIIFLLNIDPSRIDVFSLRPIDTVNTLVAIDFFPDLKNPSTSRTPEQYATQFVEMIGSHDPQLYSQDILKHTDIEYQPQIIGGKIYPENSGNKSKTVIIIVCVILGVLLIGTSVICYINRIRISEWVLWKLGNFRFRTLREKHESNINLGRELDEKNTDLESDFGEYDPYSFDPSDELQLTANSENVILLDEDESSSSFGVGFDSPDSMPTENDQ